MRLFLIYYICSAGIPDAEVDQYSNVLQVKFPAVYLGFGLLFKRLNRCYSILSSTSLLILKPRHERALDWIEKGISYLEQGLPCPASNWPGDSEKLPDTEEPKLKYVLHTLS